MIVLKHTKYCKLLTKCYHRRSKTVTIKLYDVAGCYAIVDLVLPNEPLK